MKFLRSLKRLSLDIYAKVSRTEEERALTPQEIKIVLLMAENMLVSDEELGAVLGLSRKTVAHRVSSILDKLSDMGVDSRAKLVAWAWQNGLASSEESNEESIEEEVLVY